MAIHALRQLPGGMVLLDNQGGSRHAAGGPRTLSPRDVAALFASSSTKYNRSPAEAMRIAARADSVIQGKELVAEHMIHSSDAMSRVHDAEHKRAEKIQKCTGEVYGSDNSSCKPLILLSTSQDIESSGTEFQIVRDTGDGADAGAEIKAIARVPNDLGQTNPTGTPNSEPIPPHMDISLPRTETTAPCEPPKEKLL